MFYLCNFILKKTQCMYQPVNWDVVYECWTTFWHWQSTSIWLAGMKTGWFSLFAKGWIWIYIYFHCSQIQIKNFWVSQLKKKSTSNILNAKEPTSALLEHKKWLENSNPKMTTRENDGMMGRWDSKSSGFCYLCASDCK